MKTVRAVIGDDGINLNLLGMDKVFELSDAGHLSVWKDRSIKGRNAGNTTSTEMDGWLWIGDSETKESMAEDETRVAQEGRVVRKDKTSIVSRLMVAVEKQESFLKWERKRRWSLVLMVWTRMFQREWWSKQFRSEGKKELLQ